MVAQTKNLIYKSIGTKVIDYIDFQLLIKRVSYLINSRPIGQKEALGSCPDSEVITPNKLILGYDPIVFEIVPSFWDCNHDEDPNDPTWIPDRDKPGWDKYLDKLRKIKINMDKIYYDEFITNLIKQSTDKNNRYVNKNILELEVNDLVFIKLPNCKKLKYPKALVLEVVKNDLGEVVEAKVRKANGEISNYHVSSLTLILKNEEKTIM